MMACCSSARMIMRSSRLVLSSGIVGLFLLSCTLSGQFAGASGMLPDPRTNSDSTVLLPNQHLISKVTQAVAMKLSPEKAMALVGKPPSLNSLGPKGNSPNDRGIGYTKETYRRLG